MPSKRLLFFVLLIAVIIGVMSRLPASLITDRIEQPGLKIEGVAGTIWGGEINALVVDGEPVAPIRWKLHPSALLGGKLAADVQVSPPDSEIRAKANISLNGTLELSDVEINGQLRAIASGTSLGPVAGKIVGSFAQIVVENNWPKSVDGTLDITGLRYPASANYSLGNFQLNCPSQTTPITCNIQDQGGPIQLNGQVQFTDSRQYQLTGQIKARPEANAEIRNSLGFIGQPLPDGSYNLEWSGGL